MIKWKLRRDYEVEPYLFTVYYHLICYYSHLISDTIPIKGVAVTSRHPAIRFQA